MNRQLPPRLLTIAGSDSGGGAGIQADLKAFARCGAHGMSAITAITAQNTVAVPDVFPLPPGAILEQVRAVVVQPRFAGRGRTVLVAAARGPAPWPAARV